MVIKVVLCILIPVLLLSGMMEKRSRSLAFALCAGCIACLAASFLNVTVSIWLPDCSDFYLKTSITPFVEEILKFIPILIFALFKDRGRGELICFAFAVGTGFALVENSYMLAQTGTASTVAWMLVRGIGSGLMHGMSTSIAGAGILRVRREKGLVVVGILASLFLAMMYHGAYNAMIMTDGIKYFGIFIPLISYAAALVFMDKEAIKRFLEK